MSGGRPCSVKAESAGGRVTDWRGNDPVQGGQVVAAGDLRLHAHALAMLAAGAV